MNTFDKPMPNVAMALYNPIKMNTGCFGCRVVVVSCIYDSFFSVRSQSQWIFVIVFFVSWIVGVCMRICVSIVCLFFVESIKSQSHAHRFSVGKQLHSKWNRWWPHMHTIPSTHTQLVAKHRIALIGLTNTQSIILRIKFKSLFFSFRFLYLFWCFVDVDAFFIIFLFLFFLSLFSLYSLRFTFSSFFSSTYIFLIYFFSEFSLYKAHLMAFMMIGLALRFYSHAHVSCIRIQFVWCIL